jgi:hypothetical protein
MIMVPWLYQRSGCCVRLRLFERWRVCGLVRMLEVLLICAAVFCIGGPIAAADGGVNTWVVSYRPLGHPAIGLESLVRGGVGKGVLSVSIETVHGPRVAMRVRLSHVFGQAAEAVVYGSVDDGGGGAGRSTGELDRQSAGLDRIMVMKALGGYWIRNGHPNYNLNVTIMGPVQAMWGSGPQSGAAPGYVGQLRVGEPAYRIRIRAGAGGVPQWDLRQLLPSFPGEGVYRTNYAQRECPGRLAWGRSLVRQWPYVRVGGGFLEPSSVIEPPIVLSASTGNLTMFGEVVAVRFERCSYDFYSLKALHYGGINRPDFESPWGLYDLSGRGHGLPNLIIRTQHFASNDAWSVGNDPSVLLGAPLSERPQEDVRYSWADHPGNLLFDYKIDVFGFHRYPGVVAIAGGRYRVRAPAYRAYPEWVVGQRWPSTTFIDTNGGGYATSEGIYQWPAQSVGARYDRGWSSEPELAGLGPLPVGLRGEWRVGVDSRPWLYVSPVDRRLHLWGAQGGVWNLGDGWSLVESNLTAGTEIDSWRLQYQPPVQGAGEKAVRRARDATGTPVARVEATLDALDGVLLYSGPDGVRIREVGRQLRSGPRLLPPTNHRTWVAFVRTVKSLGAGRNPRHLGSWMAAFTGPEAVWPAASLSEVRPVDGGFVAVLHVRRANGISHVPGLAAVGVGRWVVRYTQSGARSGWMVARAVGPRLVAQVRTGRLRALFPGRVQIVVHDTGNTPWFGPVRLTAGGSTLYQGTVAVAAGGTARLGFRWSPRQAGPLPVRLSTAAAALWHGTWLVVQTSRPTAGLLLAVSAWGTPSAMLAGLLLLCGIGTLVWRARW